MFSVVNIKYVRCQRRVCLVSLKAIKVSTEKLQAALRNNVQYYN